MSEIPMGIFGVRVFALAIAASIGPMASASAARTAVGFDTSTVQSGMVNCTNTDMPTFDRCSVALLPMRVASSVAAAPKTLASLNRATFDGNTFRRAVAEAHHDDGR